MDNISQLANKKPVAIVSSELHGRNHLTMWEEIKALDTHNKILICTDLPNEAENFFYD